jgi:hypothetical protein
VLSSKQGCILRRRSSANVALVTDAVVSCLRFGLDWVALGKMVAAQVLGKLLGGTRSQNCGWSCTNRQGLTMQRAEFGVNTRHYTQYRGQGGMVMQKQGRVGPGM